VSSFADVGSIEAQRIWPGVIGKAVNGDRVTLALIELEADSVVPEHRHENEQVGILLRGSLTFRIGDETRELAPGATWRIVANVPHDVRTGPNGALLVEVFAPTRDDWHALERLAGGPLWPEPAP
jgi:quercetin dioxygenase-like cupin family protein